MYIHYGSDHFDKSLFRPVKNRDIEWTKPVAGTGFWASDVDAKLGWKSWCESEEWNLDRLDKSFTFSLTPDARVKHIRSLEDLFELPCIGDKPDYSKRNDPNYYHHSYYLFNNYHIDFEKAKDEYDAIEVHISECHLLYDILYAWDCDSILIMNPDIIMEVKE